MERRKTSPASVSVARARAWSIAHGTRQRTPFRAPNMCGNESENAGAAWIAGNMTLPMLSLSVSPKMPRTWLNVTRLPPRARAPVSGPGARRRT